MENRVLSDRVVFTDRALELLRRLRAQHGELIFHLSGGCCEGSAPMCFRAADFRVGQQDVLPGVVDGCPFHVAAAHFRYVSPFQLRIDDVDGGGETASRWRQWTACALLRTRACSTMRTAFRLR